MRLKINTDGGSRGNPGPAAAAVVINDDRGRTIFCRGYYLQKTTSNVAEYEGLLHALEEAQKLGGTELEIFSDSELIVRQVNGQYRVKKPHLKNYHDEVVERMDQFEKVTLKHVSRDQNAAADTLVNQALNAGRDIEGDVEDPTSNITDKPIRAAVNVNDIIQFRQTSPYREPICRDKDFLTELICLSPNQSCPIKTTGSKTTKPTPKKPPSKPAPTSSWDQHLL